jgi:8-oxo-dGTP diphosphatase
VLATKQILVTAAVIIHQGTILMTQRLPQGNEANKWEFPGGKVELGEDPRSGLERELNEELGISVAVDKVLDVVSQVNGEQHLVIIYFHCRIHSGEPAPLQCQRVQWVGPEGIDKLDKLAADERFWKSIQTNPELLDLLSFL